MKKIIFLMIFLLLIVNCGPSESEVLQESDCKSKYENILEGKKYLEAFNDEEILKDIETAQAYRDNLRFIIEANNYFINNCEEVDSYSYLVLDEKSKLYIYLENLYTNIGYWQGVERVSYEDAFFMIYGGDDITLSQKEFEKTLRVLEKWKWGDKQDQENEKFRIISIDGYECVKVWTSQPTALLISTHPLEKYSNNNYIYESQNFSTYNCMENLDLENFDGEFYLYGQPFFYDDKWWLFKPFEPNSELISEYCLVDCFTSWQDFAAPEAILKTDPIYLEK